MDHMNKTRHVEDMSRGDNSPALMVEVGDSAEITEELTASQHQKWRELVLDIKSRTHADFSTPNGSLAPSPSSRPFRFSPMPSPIIGPRTFSLTNLFTPTKFKKTDSLPITHSNPESMHGRYAITPTKRDSALSIPRSRSVPMLINKDGSLKSLGFLRVIPTPSRGDHENLEMMHPSKLNDEHDYSGEDVAEEEAVCRICMVELGEEDSEVFKMECMCKGELALAHKECTIKWFSIKGNITCDVCKQDVKNLSVTLLRVDETRGRPRVSVSVDSQLNEWQDLPILVIVSMLAYFCFLEQLFIMEMKASAVAIALPFSCIIGLLSTITSVTMAKKKYVWIYSTIQFCLVLLFAHILYSVIRVNVGQPAVCILLAILIGFGVTIIGSAAIKVYMKWRRSFVQQTSEPASNQVSPPRE